MLVSAIEERHAPISRFFGPGIPGYRSAPRASFGVMASRLWLLFFLLIRGTHFVPTRTKLRLGLVQARHSAVCSYSECRINVEGGYRPEPSDISRNVLALVINASDRGNPADRRVQVAAAQLAEAKEPFFSESRLLRC
jgi:hypothetical protein